MLLCTKKTMGRFTAKFTTRKRYQDTSTTRNLKAPGYQQSVQPGTWRHQDTNKVYNQELEGTRIPTTCTTRNLKVPGYQQSVQPGTWRYQDTNKVYNQEKVPRYQQSVQPGNGTKISKSVQPRRECAKVPTKCTCCWYLGLLSCKSAYTAEKDLLFWQLCFSPELQLLTWFYGMILE